MADINKIVLPGSSTQHTIVADKLYSLSESFTQVESTTAELSHPVGSYLMLNNHLCRVISPIARGDTIEPMYSMPTPRNVEFVHLYDDVMPKLVEVTQAQYDALSSSEKARSDVAYMITDSDEDEEETKYRVLGTVEWSTTHTIQMPVGSYQFIWMADYMWGHGTAWSDGTGILYGEGLKSFSFSNHTINVELDVARGFQILPLL